MKGKQITTPSHVLKLAQMRRSVINKFREKPMPAAFLIGMPFNVVMSMISGGVLFEYLPKKK